jgi:alginate O-acetyltransferase complex protein AlgI
VLFSSTIFLFCFLPIVLLLYYVAPKRLKNTVLLISSLLFYAWGEVFYVGVMLVSILTNYITGLLIGKSLVSTKSKKWPRLFLIIGLIVNIGLLFSFKYANFFADNLNVLLSFFDIKLIQLEPIHLPLGISFFTFQAISYIVDVYRKETSYQKNILNLALYISLFPQLIAGPIVRYHDVAKQIVKRSCSFDLFASGVQKFIFGLSKKMLLANPLGEVTDVIFGFSSADLTMPVAWIGIISYTFQIYFDFSGYSDMAIGLGRMFGFHFMENFNYPYISKSIREFWRRWHISLSSWFKDYVYIPLGGSRCSTFRVYTNLFIVFVLTGLWHGASWNFLIWGLFHGTFLTCEHAGFSKVLKKLWSPLQHLYVLLLVIIGWVFFRADTLGQAVEYIKTMFDFSDRNIRPDVFYSFFSHEALLVFAIAIICSTPIYSLCRKVVLQNIEVSNWKAVLLVIFRLIVLLGLLMLCIFKTSSSTYNPFIYFRF